MYKSKGSKGSKMKSSEGCKTEYSKKAKPDMNQSQFKNKYVETKKITR